MSGRPPRILSGPQATADRWPTWYGGLGFFIAIGGAVLIGGFVAIASGGSSDSVAGIVGTLIQDVMLLVIAVALARSLGRPSLADFGWRRAPVKLALTWFAAGAAAFYVGSFLYSLVLQPKGKQDVLETLGANDSTASLVMTALIVIVLAPICEETFFRGFFYRSLRNGMSAARATAVIAVIFGLIHYSGPDTLILLPVLAGLGAIFCILYERTGSLFPSIGLHALNNSLALAATAASDSAPAIAGVAGIVMLTGCAVLTASGFGSRPAAA